VGTNPGNLYLLGSVKILMSTPQSAEISLLKLGGDNCLDPLIHLNNMDTRKNNLGVPALVYSKIPAMP